MVTHNYLYISRDFRKWESIILYRQVKLAKVFSVWWLSRFGEKGLFDQKNCFGFLIFVFAMRSESVSHFFKSLFRETKSSQFRVGRRFFSFWPTLLLLQGGDGMNKWVSSDFFFILVDNINNYKLRKWDSSDFFSFWLTISLLQGGDGKSKWALSNFFFILADNIIVAMRSTISYSSVVSSYQL